jgi:anti-sigma factor RsiW
MDINRTTYEEYFLLYLDNELSDEHRRTVEQFLDSNPDLMPEFLALKETIFESNDQVSFGSKEALYHTSASSTVNEKNYEEMLVLYFDGELNDVEKKEVESFAVAETGRQASFNLVGKARLIADDSVGYRNKEELYRHEKTRRIVPVWMRWSAAAIFLLSAGAIWLFPNRSSEPVVAQQQPQQKANNDTNDKPVTAATLPERQLPQADKPAVVPDQPVAKSILKESDPTRRRTQSGNFAQQRRGLGETTTADSKMRSEPAVPRVETDVLIASADRPLERVAQSQVSNGTSLTTEVAAQQAPMSAAPQTDVAKFTFEPQAEDDVLYVANTTINPKTRLRGIFRKASRIFDKALSSESSHAPKSVRIGNLQFALDK